MSFKAVLLILGIIIATGGAVFVPLLGVLGYMTHYNLGVDRQWWAKDILHAGVRTSLMLAVATAIGCVLNYRRLRTGGKWLFGHEKLILAFLGIVWLSVAVGSGMREVGVFDHPAIKFTKFVVFLFMLTHVVTTLRSLNWVMWTLTVGSLLLGVQAYTSSSYGRLETVGGPDFADSNALAAYIAAMLPIIAIQALRTGWIGRGVCALAGVFSVNAIVLCRSRGALVGIAAGSLAALLLAPGKHRLKIIGGLLITLVAFCFLANPAFWDRAMTLGDSGKVVDPAKQARLDIWEGGKKMFLDHPQGVGAGNFNAQIGRYCPKYKDFDAHNTFVRCFCELGLQGGVMLLVILFGSFLAYRKAHIRAMSLPLEQRKSANQIAFALVVGLTIFVVSGLAGTLLFVEGFWWLLALPVCMLRAVENAYEDLDIAVPNGSKARGGRSDAGEGDDGEDDDEPHDQPVRRVPRRRRRPAFTARDGGVSRQ